MFMAIYISYWIIRNHVSVNAILHITGNSVIWITYTCYHPLNTLFAYTSNTTPCSMCGLCQESMCSKDFSSKHIEKGKH